MPCLVVQGERSDILPDDLALKLTAAIKRGRHVRVPGAGHGVHSDRPEAFIEAVRAFLAET